MIFFFNYYGMWIIEYLNTKSSMQGLLKRDDQLRIKPVWTKSAVKGRSGLYYFIIFTSYFLVFAT